MVFMAMGAAQQQALAVHLQWSVNHELCVPDAEAFSQQYAFSSQKSAVT
jgi:hypothetical protein